MPGSIYLDYNATTPVDPRVLEQMIPWFTDQFWNAASAHGGGRAASKVADAARESVANLVGARPAEIIWTSGATEANNLALKGVVERCRPDRRRVVTVATEHKAVLDAAAWLAERGSPVSVLPVDPEGRLSLGDLEAELAQGDVAVVSVMAANNETGVVADLASVAELAHAAGALLHSDLTQAIGRIPVDVEALGVDLGSMSAHKLYGPKGVGALFVSRRTSVAPQIHGGGHERSLRSGTLNVPGIVGFGAAAVLAQDELGSEPERQRQLVARLLLGLQAGFVEVVEVSDLATGLPNTLNVRLVGADSEAVMANAPGVAVSTGSACTARVPVPSHVLLAMGLSPREATECLRVTVGRPTTLNDVEAGARALVVAASRVRELTA